METLIQHATRMNQERHWNEQGKLGAFAGQVTDVSPLNDTLGMTFGPAPRREMPVVHPFVSDSSWIRSMPTVGTLYLMMNRFDSGQPDAIKTLPGFSQVRSDNYQQGLNFYRPLQPGEHDIVSEGYACAFFGAQGNVDLRSGASVKVQLNRQAQETYSQAPTQRRTFLFNAPGTLGDEERVGIVKRWTSASDEFYVRDENHDNAFQAERYLQLLNPAKSGPVVLLEHTEGQVYDEAGEQILHETTALPLRSQSLWYTTTDESLTLQIDQNGNLLYDFPSTASTGMEIQIPSGSYRAVIGKDRDVSIDNDETVVVQGNISYTVGGNVSYTIDGTAEYDVTDTVTWNAGSHSWIMDTDANSVTVTSAGSAEFGTSAGGKLKISEAGLVALGNQTGELLALIYQMMTALGTVQILTPMGEAAPMTASSNWVQVQQIMQTIQSITGSL